MLKKKKNTSQIAVNETTNRRRLHMNFSLPKLIANITTRTGLLLLSQLESQQTEKE